MRNLKLKSIFLIDAIGAITTAFLLMVVLRTFNQYIGLPKETLSQLSMIALLLAIYSACCFVFANKDSQKLLKPIIGANLAYCILTIGLLFFHKNSVTAWGGIYFIGEVVVILGLVYLEINALKASK
jgi:hypothetical protein